MTGAPRGREPLRARARSKLEVIEPARLGSPADPLRKPCPGAGSSSRAAGGGGDASVAVAGGVGSPRGVPSSSAAVTGASAGGAQKAVRSTASIETGTPIPCPAPCCTVEQLDVRAIPPIPPSERDDASAVCSTTVSWTSSWRSSAAAPFIDWAPAWSTSDRFSAAASLLATPPVDETVWLVTESAAAIWPTCADCAAVCEPVPSLRAASCTAACRPTARSVATDRPRAAPLPVSRTTWMVSATASASCTTCASCPAHC